MLVTPNVPITLQFTLTTHQAIKMVALLPIGAAQLTEDYGDPDHAILIDAVTSAVSQALEAVRRQTGKD